MRPGGRGGRDPRAHPDERSLRVREPARRHVRPGLVPAYVPGYLALRLDAASGTTLPAAHATSIAFDLLCLLGLGLVGLRFGGPRLGATLAFAWAAYPFTQYASNSNTNDSILPAFLIWGFWLVDVARRRAARSPRSRAGRSSRRWSSRRCGLTYSGWSVRRIGAFLAGFAAATAASRSGSSSSSRPPRTRSGCSGTGRSRGSSSASRRSRCGTGAQYHARPARPAFPAGRARGRRCRRRGRVRACAAPQDAAPARGPHRRAAARLRARLDALVLPLHPVVLPVRRVRDVRRPLAMSRRSRPPASRTSSRTPPGCAG